MLLPRAPTPLAEQHASYGWAADAEYGWLARSPRAEPGIVHNERPPADWIGWLPDVADHLVGVYQIVDGDEVGNGW